MGNKFDSSKNSHSAILLMLGSRGGVADIIAYNTTTNTFTRLKPPKQKAIGEFSLKLYMGCIAVSVNSVYLSGGINEQFQNISNQLILWNPIKNSYQILPSMNQARYGHEFVYKDGFLYAIAGRTYGKDLQGLLDSCERYNIKYGKWQQISPLFQKRATAHTIVFSGRIYVFGGYVGGQVRSTQIEVYDDKNDLWNTLTLSLHTAVETGTILPTENGFIILGGQSEKGLQRTAQQVDLTHNASGTYKPIKLNKPRVLAKSYLVGQYLYIIGGDEDQVTVEVVDQNEATLISYQVEGDVLPVCKLLKGYAAVNWTLNIPIVECQPYFTQQQIVLGIEESTNTPVQQVNVSTEESKEPEQYNQRSSCFIFGASAVMKLDVVKKQVTHIKHKDEFPILMGGVALNDNQFLLIGGVTRTMNKIYDTTRRVTIDDDGITIRWLAPMKQVRYAFTVQKLGNLVIVAGGRHYGGDDQAILPTVECLDLSQGDQAQWKELAPMNSKRTSPMSFVHMGKMYVMGGYKGHYQREKTIEVYDQVTDRWMLLGIMMPKALEACYLVNLSQPLSTEINLVLFGGRDQTGDTDGVYYYSFDLSRPLDTQTMVNTTVEKGLSQKMCQIKGFPLNDKNIFLLGQYGTELYMSIFNIDEKKELQWGLESLQTQVLSSELWSKQFKFTQQLLI